VVDPSVAVAVDWNVPKEVDHLDLNATSPVPNAFFLSETTPEILSIVFSK